MGNYLSCTLGGGAQRRGANSRGEMTLLVIGLDGAGKSTIIANIMEETVDDVLPTIGFANATASVAGCQVQLYDVGGGPRIRGIWKNYYAQSHGIIFIVDASSSERLEEAKQILGGVLREETVMGKPLLVMANKQDQLGALSPEEMREKLELESLSMTDGQQHTVNVVGCVGLSGDGERRRTRRDIVRSVGRLVREVTRRWEEVSERVSRDTDRQRERQEKEREERKERVRKIREERERQAGLLRDQNGAPHSREEGEEEEEEENVPLVNPFKPISEVVAVATERETRAKQLRQTVVPGQSELEERREEERREEERRGEERREGDGGGVLSAGAGSVSSGLSESSDSLTHVTVPSKEDNSTNSESLGGTLTTPTADPITTGTNQQPPVALETTERRRGGGDSDEAVVSQIANRRTSSRWSRSKFNLFSRLKSHNKIAPSPHSISTTTSAELHSSSFAPPHPVVSHTIENPTTSTSTDPVFHPVLLPLPNGALSTTRKQEEVGGEKEGREEEENGAKSSLGREADRFNGLPELPKHRHSLPPIQVHKRLPGLQEQTFTTSVDIGTDVMQNDTIFQTLTSND